MKNLSKIYNWIENGEDFLVLKNSKPVFRVIWVKNYQKKVEVQEDKEIYFPKNIFKNWFKVKKTWKIQNKKKFLEDLDKISFNSWEKNLSQQVDTILYGR